LFAALAIAWVFFLLGSSAAESWDGLALSALVTVLLGVMTFVGLVAGIGFLAAGLMEHDRPAILWSAVLVVAAAIPVVVTLATRGP
jgi:hypothetical protein